MERPLEERPAIKGKAGHKNKNCTSCQSLSGTLADTVTLCKSIGFIFENVNWRVQLFSKTPAGTHLL